MPYFDQPYCDTLNGKTVSHIEPFQDRKRQVIKIHWTDGTYTEISACAEHRVIDEEWSLVAHTIKEPKYAATFTVVENSFLRSLRALLISLHGGSAIVEANRSEDTLYVSISRVTHHKVCVPVMRSRLVCMEAIAPLVDEVVEAFGAMIEAM